MCIISNKVEKVAKTKILVGVNKLDPTIQLTVYCNSVSNNTDGNAMILPVPNPHSVRYHDLSNYKDIFTDCNRCFSKPIARSWSLNFNAKSSNKSLEVFNVGSYKVSLAKSLQDLQRVDKNVFNLSFNCGEMLSKEYSNPIFGFIICKLAKGKEDYHPFGYSHEMIDNTVFIPTKHYHEHNAPGDFFNGFNSDFDNFADFNNNNNNNSSNLTDDWEHEIFLYNATGKTNKVLKDMYSNKNEFWTEENHLKLNKFDFDLGELLNFEKYVIFGSKPNVDLLGITCFEQNKKSLSNSKILSF